MRRQVIRTVNSTTSTDGAGVYLERVLGPQTVLDFDPFLKLDAFDTKKKSDYIKGFPQHPHRGIEIVTYLIKGTVEHSDSLGNKGVIHDGESQWMTAGSGIMHQEMPQPVDHFLALQLWINLSKATKMTEPKCLDITKDKIQVIEEKFGIVRVLSGKYKGKKGALNNYIDTTIMDIEVNPWQTFSLPTDKESNLFIYIIKGAGSFGDEDKEYSAKKAILFSKDTDFFVRAGEDGIRFVLFIGRPLRESIAWGGPIVMNTRQELNHAYNELDNGTFIKHKQAQDL